MSSYLDYPFAIDARGRAAVTDPDEHLRDLIEQVLFTNPGERVNRPDFGCGLGSLLFLPNSDALATATQTLTKAALQQWLEDEIRVDSVEIDAQGEVLTVTVAFTRQDTGAAAAATFVRGGTA